MFRISRVLALTIFAAVSLSAQTPDTASVRGQVADQSHAALAGVDVTITNKLVGSERTTATDAAGNFVFSGLPIGNYMLLARKKDFADVTQEITLIGVTAVKEEVLVTGTAGQIRTDEPQLGDRLGQEQLEEMPLLNSRITYLPLLLQPPLAGRIGLWSKTDSTSYFKDYVVNAKKTRRN